MQWNSRHYGTSAITVHWDETMNCEWMNEWMNEYDDEYKNT